MEWPMEIESLSVFIVMGSFDNFPLQARHPRMIPQATVSRNNEVNFIIVLGYAVKVPFEKGSVNSSDLAAIEKIFYIKWKRRVINK